MKELNGYELSRKWFDWSYDNIELVKPHHGALYFFIIDKWNRLGQPNKFGLPTDSTMAAIGIRNRNTFLKTLKEIVKFGFLKLVEKAKNQFSSNIIAICKNDKATTKALGNALILCDTKHCYSTASGTDTINKPNNLITKEPNNLKIDAHEENENEIIYAYDDELFKNSWDKWSKHWAEKNDRAVMSEMQRDAVMRRLSEFQNIEYAVYLIKSSIEKNYKHIGFDYFMSKQEFEENGNRKKEGFNISNFNPQALDAWVGE